MTRASNPVLSGAEMRVARLRSRLQTGFLIYFALVLGVAVLPPFVRLWNKVQPSIFGLPCAQFAILIFALLLSVGLITWYLIEGRLNVQERAERLQGQIREQ